MKSSPNYSKDGIDDTGYKSMSTSDGPCSPDRTLEDVESSNKSLGEIAEEPVKEMGAKPLTIWGATLAYVGTIVGGGIVGLPFAIFETGIPLGVFLHILVSCLTIYACWLYFKTRELIGDVEYAYYLILTPQIIGHFQRSAS